jgi:acetoin utilization deacetylase AcuC-like enzyme
MSLVTIFDPCTPRQRHVANSSNQPETRSLRIQEELRRHHIPLHSNTEPLPRETLEKLGVHEPEYLDFLATAYADAEKWNDLDWFSKGQLIPNHFLNLNSNALALNSRKHLPMYKLSGFYGNDTMSPITEMTYTQALMSARNSYLAAEMAAANPKQVVYALNASPGHHASSRGYSGYCFINNAGVAARRLWQLGYRKVAVLDLDYHAGNGTQHIFYYDPDILTLSIHADPRFEYPSFSGFVDEIGAYQGLGTNVNLPLPPKTDWGKYAEALAFAMQQIQLFRAQALVIAFGGDTYKEDPDASAIAGFSLELDDYPKMGHMVKQGFTGPIVVTQEGGYCIDKIGSIVLSFLQALVK